MRLEFVQLRGIAASVADMDDDHVIFMHSVVDQIRITGDWKHSDTGSIGLASKSWIPCE